MNALTTAIVLLVAPTVANAGFFGPTSGVIPDLTVDSAKLKNGAADSEKIAKNAVNGEKIQPLVIDSSKMGKLSIDSEKLNDNAVLTRSIMALNVTGAKIAAMTIDSTKMGNASVDSEKMAKASVDTEKIHPQALLDATKSAWFNSLRQETAKSCNLGTTTDASGVFTGCVASDERLKTAIRSFKYNASLIDSLRPVFYSWRNGGVDANVHSGFIAQEVEKVLPSAVVPAGAGGLKGVDPNAVLAALVSEVQALRKRVAVLEKRK